jgi:hypothetical protein
VCLIYPDILVFNHPKDSEHCRLGLWWGVLATHVKPEPNPEGLCSCPNLTTTHMNLCPWPKSRPKLQNTMHLNRKCNCAGNKQCQDVETIKSTPMAETELALALSGWCLQIQLMEIDELRIRCIANHWHKIFFYEANCGCSSQLMRFFSPIGQLAQTIGFQSTGIDWCLVRPRDLKGKRERHKRAVEWARIVCILSRHF